MKFVAIDSSLANTGIAIGEINTLGKVMITAIMLHETKKSKNKQIRASSDAIDRCRGTYNFVQEIIKDVNPAVIFAETPSGSQSSNAMKSYGATCMLIAVISPPPIEVTPIEVKLATVGDKTASKDRMIQWAYGKYPDLDWDKNSDGSLKNKNEHMADAIAIAYASVKTNEFIRLQSLMR